MAAYALALYVLYLALAFGARTVLQLRRTGSSGVKGISGRPGSAEWTGGVLFVFAFGLLLMLHNTPRTAHPLRHAGGR